MKQVFWFSGWWTGLECFQCTFSIIIINKHRLTHTHSGLALESLITILTARYIPFFMLLLIIGMNFLPLHPILIMSFVQQMLPCVFTQSTCCPKYFATAMPRLSITSQNLYERSYSERGIDVSRFHDWRFFWPKLIGYSGRKLCHPYYMGHHLLHNAHAFPVGRKKKRRRCREGTI